MSVRERGNSVRRIWIALGLLVFVGMVTVILGLAVTHPKIRPRISLVAHKLTGERADVSWASIFSQLLPYALRAERNPYLLTRNPHTSPQDLAAGAARFRSQCAPCHAPDGGGGAGANLTTGVFKYGSSDLGIFNTITGGVPGTAMQGFELAERDIWQLVAHVRSLNVGPADASATLPKLADPDLSYRRLLAARDEPHNWPTYAGAYDSNRYSSLDSIHTGNVASLGTSWVYQMETIYTRVESSPLVVDGVMYVTEPNGTSMALDAATGERLWLFERNPKGKIPLCCGRVNRGFAALDNAVFIGSLDAHLISLDARTGELRWDVIVEDYRRGYSITVAPLALDGKVIVGVSGGEYGIRGFIDAYDAETGDLLWRRFTVPGPGEPGHETWQGDSWKTGGAPTWVTGSFDPELNLLYWGVGNPGPVFVGDGRQGDNLYSNSVLALDPNTGEIRWHFQFTPHDTHDWDANQSPVLVDRDWQGKPRKLMLWANRNGFFYVLDRATGEFLLAEQFGRQSWAEGIDENGRPIEIPGMEPSPEGMLIYPGVSGATNWWPPSYSPQTDLFYVPVLEWGTIVFSSGEPEYSAGDLFQGSAEAQIPLEQGRIMVRAIAPDTGLAKWEHEMPGGLSRRPQLAKRLGGLLSTGGGLVFGADRSRFLALDARTGVELWSQELGAQIVAGPVSYEIDGVQYISVSAGRSVFSFKLPE
ncbi:MAG: PQQ-dependent dehydrogenase, methanol/ethanol family [bacterium]|nr:PQQ-dependent dehydrogenase, methanol/ethanol family [bacterium]MCP5069658.1 PQQ-dependent dehydrogenase, methanol/ethanol family [bacterium]